MLIVDDERALPAPGSGAALASAARGRVGVAIYPLDSGAPPGPLAWSPPPVLTLFEVERMDTPAEAPVRDLAGPPGASPARFVPDGAIRGAAAAAGFRVIRVPETFGIREEILARIPPSARRLLDVGCGGGETAAAARKRVGGLRAEGIDREGAPSDACRPELDAFHSGDAIAVLRAMAARSETFDVLLFADVLEHCEDPFLVLQAAREVCAPGASVIASVPNAASAPVVEGLIAGRFDPVGAGPEDAGHLRWFTRRSLSELLEESGFSVASVEAMPLPGDTGLPARLAGAGIAFETGELGAIQWIATATLAGDA
jgi:SAM-dependent methyltransferase